MNRPEIIQYIQARDKFYEFTQLEAHSDEQLMSIKERIDAMDENKRCENKELGEKGCRESRELS
jgi:hypothetical protein